VIAVDERGRFSATNIERGDYAIRAFVGGRYRPEDRRESEAAFVPIRIDSTDVTDLVVTLARTVDVIGRVTLEDSATSLPRRPGYAPLLVRARLQGDSTPRGGGSESASLGEDRLFYLTGLFGRRTFDVLNVPSGWFVKAIKYGGRDISDTPTEFKASGEPGVLEILLSNRGAVISGRVVDDRGEPVGGVRVLIFPADAARWGIFQVPYVAASATGAFRSNPQRRGDYLVAALAASAPVPEFDDRERMARLVKLAERVTLGEFDERTVDVRVVTDQ
jgi:hypothetical protein